jgi:hypothetical protein
MYRKIPAKNWSERDKKFDHTFKNKISMTLESDGETLGSLLTICRGENRFGIRLTYNEIILIEEVLSSKGKHFKALVPTHLRREDVHRHAILCVHLIAESIVHISLKSMPNAKKDFLISESMYFKAEELPLILKGVRTQHWL